MDLLITSIDEHLVQVESGVNARPQAGCDLGRYGQTAPKYSGCRRADRRLVVSYNAKLQSVSIRQSHHRLRGQAPHAWISGSSVNRPARIGHSGNSRLRQALYMAMTCDYHDHAQAQLDSLHQFFREHAVPDSTRMTMERSIRHTVAQNGPVYLFEIKGVDGAVVTGSTRRYRTNFRSALPFDSALEGQIIALLRTLNVGYILCDTPTDYFTVPYQEYPDTWQLAD